MSAEYYDSCWCVLSDLRPAVSCGENNYAPFWRKRYSSGILSRNFNLNRNGEKFFKKGTVELSET